MIELKNISVSFGKQQVIKDVSISFFEGEVIGLVAPNGTGKSTLLNIMMNYLKPQTGEAIIHQDKRYGTPKVNSQIYREISMMPDQNDLYLHFTGFDHLKMFQDMWQSSQISLTDIVEELEMGHYVNKKVSGYSLGMKQRLCFAMQMASNTSIMLMDEVMNGLDPTNVELISQIILKKREEGKTIIIASHLLENLEKYANRIFFLTEGKLELFLDKTVGYADNRSYLKLTEISDDRIRRSFPHQEIIGLKNGMLLLPFDEKAQLEGAVAQLIQENILTFSIGKLSLSEAYQLKF